MQNLVPRVCSTHTHTHMHVHIHTHMSIYKLYTMWFMHNLDSRDGTWKTETKTKHMLTPNMTWVRLREKVAAFSFVSLPRPAVEKNGLADISSAALLIFGAWCCVQCSDQLINSNFCEWQILLALHFSKWFCLCFKKLNAKFHLIIYLNCKWL